MRWIDLAVIVLYLAAITWFGAQFRTGQNTLKDYFLGGRRAPWWAIALSIVSAETSTLTVIGTPALSFNGNFGFLQLVFGYLLARIVISTLFLPAYFRGEMFTAYELMRRRFGGRIRRVTAGTFLVLRALAEGVRVFAISIVISIILGTGEMTSIVFILILTLLYTYEGGMTAVIWTDVVQMFLYVVGAGRKIAPISAGRAECKIRLRSVGWIVHDPIVHGNCIGHRVYPTNRREGVGCNFPRNGVAATTGSHAGNSEPSQQHTREMHQNHSWVKELWTSSPAAGRPVCPGSHRR